MKMVRDFEKHAESGGHQSLTKEAAKYAEEYGLQLSSNTLIQPASQKKERLYQERSLKPPEERARIKTERGRRGPDMATEVGYSKRR